MLACKQESSALFGLGQHVIFFKEARIVTCDEIGTGDKVRLAKKLFAESQVGNRNRPSLLRIINEVTLDVVFGQLADYHNRVMIRPNRPIRTQTIEHRAEHAFIRNLKRFINIETVVSDIINDADTEFVLRACRIEIVKYCLDHRRREFLRTQTIPAAHNKRILLKM